MINVDDERDGTESREAGDRDLKEEKKAAQVVQHFLKLLKNMR